MKRLCLEGASNHTSCDHGNYLGFMTRGELAGSCLGVLVLMFVAPLILGALGFGGYFLFLHFVGTHVYTTIETRTVPDPVSGSSYIARLSASLGESGLGLTSTTGADVTWSWSATGVPPGMEVTSAGVLQGNPNKSGHWTIRVTATPTSRIRSYYSTKGLRSSSAIIAVTIIAHTSNSELKAKERSCEGTDAQYLEAEIVNVLSREVTAGMTISVNGNSGIVTTPKIAGDLPDKSEPFSLTGPSTQEAALSLTTRKGPRDLGDTSEETDVTEHGTVTLGGRTCIANYSQTVA